MDKLVLHIVFLLTLFISNAQENLVPNGSFEEYNWCPESANGYYINSSEHWMMPTLGSSDYFNICSQETDGFGNYLFSVPQNYEGYQNARTGYAYGGYYAALTPKNINYYEYLSVKLTSPLQIGKSYKLTYYVSVADSFYKSPQSLQFINHSAALLSKFNYQANNTDRIPFLPQVKSDPSILLNDSTNWQKIEGVFSAEGGEEFLTIGCFVNYEDLSYNYLPSASSDSSIAVYYYVDDVSLIEYDIEEIVPNVFTPNGDGINDLFQIDSTLIRARELIILNRWGNIVYQSEDIFEWDGKDSKNQQICSDGVYFVRIKTPLKDLNGFVQLIR